MNKPKSAIFFNKIYFFRTILIFLILTIGWTLLCIRTNEFTERDKGFFSGLGFLLLFASSLYFGQPRKPLLFFWKLTGLTIAVFLIATFVLGPLIGLTSNSEILYAIANSLFVSIIMTRLLHKFYTIHLKYLTIAFTFTMLLIAYFLIFKLGDSYYLKYNIHPRISMFNIFQFMLLIPLTTGLSLMKVAETPIAE